MGTNKVKEGQILMPSKKQRGNAELMLGVYRGLDFSDEQGMSCGKILADFGADVIKVERPGGDKTRNIGPFCGDIPASDRGVYWLATNASKRGITLDIETEDGKELFRKLVKTVDFIVESFPPGYLQKLGFGYEDMCRINPRIVVASITPFGSDGPYRDYKGCDLVYQALGGVSNECGEPDRAPLRIGPIPQSYYFAGHQAALGICIALYHRTLTGEGQHIDVSVYESMALRMPSTGAMVWDAMKMRTRRWGGGFFRSDAKCFIRFIYACKDGYVVWNMHTGLPGHFTRLVVEWMVEEGQAGDLSDIDWYKIDLSKKTKEDIEGMQDTFARFFQRYTKKEIYEQAIKRNMPIYPVYTAEDLLKDPQLKSRDFWVDVEHPEIGYTMTFPGAVVKASETPCRIPRRAPLVGEHNQEIYGGELGLSRDEIIRLAEAGAI
ncbi:MAG: CoA transferase [Dehalococcoidia bacterium]